MNQSVLTLDWVEECWRRRDDINFVATDLTTVFSYLNKIL